MAWFSRGREQRAAVSGPPLPGPLDVMAGGVAGVRVDERSALANPVVWASVRTLGDAVSSLRLEAFHEAQPGAMPVKLAVQPPLVTDPFALVNVQSGLFQTVAGMATAGNGCWQVIERHGDATAPTTPGMDPDTPSKLRVLHPDTVVVKLVEGALSWTVGGKPVPAEDIVHLPYVMMPGALRGVGPIEVNSGSLSWAIGIQEYGNNFLGQGCSLSGVIEVPGELTRDAAKGLKEGFVAKHGGLRKSHAVGLLTGGAKFNPITLSPEASQLLQSRQYSAIEIAMLFGVPGSMLGLPAATSNWGAGVAEIQRGFLTFTLRPYLSRIEAAVTALLPAGVFARFNTDELTRMSPTEMAGLANSGIQNGWLNADEARAMFGRDAIPGGAGTVFRSPLALAPTADANGAIEPAADPADPAATTPATTATESAA